jgi:DNA-binding NarL/FixJ family response regulator
MRALGRRVRELQLAVPPAPDPAEPQPANLSEREAQVLRLLAMGRSNAQIARELYISANTVASHVKNILSKTRASNRAEAAAFAVRKQIV